MYPYLVSALVSALLSVWDRTPIGRRLRSDSAIVSYAHAAAERQGIDVVYLLAVGVQESGLDPSVPLCFGAVARTVRWACGLEARCAVDPTYHGCPPNGVFPRCGGSRAEIQAEVSAFILARGLRGCATPALAFRRYQSGRCGSTSPSAAAYASSVAALVARVRDALRVERNRVSP